ncbi:MAG: DUF4397 domain-containing protein [Anaerolineae bacterium]
MLEKRTVALSTLLMALALVVSPLATLSVAAQVPALAPRIRVVHAAPGTAAVDVLVGGVLAIPNLAYGDVAPYGGVGAGTVTVSGISTGTMGPELFTTDVAAVAGGRYTVVITGTATPLSTVVLQDMMAPPPPTGASVRFVHASPDTAAVDVAVTGGAVLATNLAFGNASDHVTMIPGAHALEIRPTGTTTVALSIPSLMVQAATSYTVLITGLSAGTPALSALVVPEVGYASLRLVHAAAGVPAVDIYVEGMLIGSNLAYGQMSDYATTVSNSYTVMVFPTGTMVTPLLMAVLNIEPNTQYTGLVAGTAAMPIAMLITDTNTAPSAGMARVRFVHLSPDAPAVDIALTGGSVLASNLTFGEVSDYVNVAVGVRSFEVRPTGTTTVALAVPGVSLREGLVYTVYVTGMVSGTPALQALVSQDAQFVFAVYLPTVDIGQP